MTHKLLMTPLMLGALVGMGTVWAAETSPAGAKPVVTSPATQEKATAMKTAEKPAKAKVSKKPAKLHKSHASPKK